MRTFIASALVSAALVIGGAAPAAATPYSGFQLDATSPCLAGACTATVSYVAYATVRVEVDFDPDVTGDTRGAFHADIAMTCAPAGSADAFYGRTPQVCKAVGPRYRTAGRALIGVRVVGADGSDAFSYEPLDVRGAPGCEVTRPGETCESGGGRHVRGGKNLGGLSAAGWPAITGIVWQVVGGGRSAHSHVGTAGSDALLGRHGSDRLNGGAGDDLLYPGPGRSRVLGGAGNDTIRATRGGGTIDCGDGVDTVRIRSSRTNFDLFGCERVRRVG